MRILKLTIPVILGLTATAAYPQMASAQIGIGISVHIAPPALPVYVQPPIPAPGYIWTPGYWAYGEDDYYWVPGTWVEPPSVGVLWTPAWWGWNDGIYAFHAGYWGPHVGFYGGINYGFGYGGVGFEGGYWNHGAFAYNRTVNNLGGANIGNTYNKTVINNNTTINRTSFNGGAGGINAQPSAEQRAAEHEEHIQPTSAQTQHFQTAAATPNLRANANHGQPAIAATARPYAFAGQGVMPARAAGQAPAGAPNAARTAAVPNAARPAGTSPTGTPNAPRVAGAPNAPRPAVTPNAARVANAPRPAGQAPQAHAAAKPGQAPHPQVAARPAPHPAQPHPAAPHSAPEHPAAHASAGKPPHRG